MNAILIQVVRVLEASKREWTDGHGKILLAIASRWGLSLGVQLACPVMLPHLRSVYGLTLASTGALLSVLWVAYALGQLPGRMLADRYGEGAVMVVSMALERCRYSS